MVAPSCDKKLKKRSYYLKSSTNTSSSSSLLSHHQEHRRPWSGLTASMSGKGGSTTAQHRLNSEKMTPHPNATSSAHASLDEEDQSGLTSDESFEDDGASSAQEEEEEEECLSLLRRTVSADDDHHAERPRPQRQRQRQRGLRAGGGLGPAPSTPLDVASAAATPTAARQRQRPPPSAPGVASSLPPPSLRRSRPSSLASSSSSLTGVSGSTSAAAARNKVLMMRQKLKRSREMRQASMNSESLTMATATSHDENDDDAQHAVTSTPRRAKSFDASCFASPAKGTEGHGDCGVGGNDGGEEGEGAIVVHESPRNVADFDAALAAASSFPVDANDVDAAADAETMTPQLTTNADAEDADAKADEVIDVVGAEDDEHDDNSSRCATAVATSAAPLMERCVDDEAPSPDEEGGECSAFAATPPTEEERERGGRVVVDGTEAAATATATATAEGEEEAVPQHAQQIEDQSTSAPLPPTEGSTDEERDKNGPQIHDHLARSACQQQQQQANDLPKQETTTNEEEAPMMKKEIQRLERECDKLKQERQTQQDEWVQTVQRNHDRMLEKTQVLLEDKNATIVLLQKKLNQSQTQYDEMSSQHDREIKYLKECHQRELHQMKADVESTSSVRISQLETDVASLTTKNSSLNDKLIKNMERSYKLEEERNAARAKTKDLMRELQQQQQSLVSNSMSSPSSSPSKSKRRSSSKAVVVVEHGEHLVGDDDAEAKQQAAGGCCADSAKSPQQSCRRSRRSSKSKTSRKSSRTSSSRKVKQDAAQAASSSATTVPSPTAAQPSDLITEKMVSLEEELDFTQLGLNVAREHYVREKDDVELQHFDELTRLKCIVKTLGTKLVDMTKKNAELEERLLTFERRKAEQEEEGPTINMDETSFFDISRDLGEQLELMMAGSVTSGLREIEEVEKRCRRTLEAQLKSLE